MVDMPRSREQQSKRCASACVSWIPKAERVVKYRAWYLWSLCLSCSSSFRKLSFPNSVVIQGQVGVKHGSHSPLFPSSLGSLNPKPEHLGWSCCSRVLQRAMGSEHRSGPLLWRSWPLTSVFCKAWLFSLPAPFQQVCIFYSSGDRVVLVTWKQRTLSNIMCMLGTGFPQKERGKG